MPLVELSRLEEDRAAHRAAARPERLGLAGVPVVHVVVQQVAVLGDDAGRRRVGVVRPEGGAHAGIVGEQLGHAGERVGVHAGVGVDKDDDFTA